MQVAYHDVRAAQELSPTGVVLHAWHGKPLRSPSGIARAPDGEPFVADPGSGVVLRLVGGRWVAVVRSGIGAGDEGIARRIAAGLNGSIARPALPGRWFRNTTSILLGAVPADRPEDVAVDAPGGRVSFLDAGGTRVQEFDS